MRDSAAAGRRDDPAPGATVIEASRLEVTPPGADGPVVRDVSIRVREGEWLALTGPNGGGKTSLLMVLAGLWPATGGRVERETSGPVAVVLQDPSSQILSPTVGEEIAFAARNLGQPEDEIARAVARWSAAFGVADELGRDPATLSAGRQQLVLLAGALAARPRLLLADEATAHVDLAGRARVRAALAAEVAGGLTIVSATQDPDELAVATRTLTVGAADGAPPGTGPDPAPRPGLVAVRLRISPAPAGEGPRVCVARPLEIDVAGPGITALLGANGSGKSVLLAAAAGLEPLAQVGVEWMVPPALPPIAALQYPELQVFEERVADELVFAAVARGLARAAALAAASEYLRRMGIEAHPFMERRTWTLSTGEKRVVELLAALIAPASLVLLDEPTGGLDPGRRQVISGLVMRRSHEVPVVVASQDLEWVAAVGARSWTLGV